MVFLGVALRTFSKFSKVRRDGLSWGCFTNALVVFVSVMVLVLDGDGVDYLLSLLLLLPVRVGDGVCQ